MIQLSRKAQEYEFEQEDFNKKADQILTSEALSFLSELHSRFASRVDELLNARKQRQAQIDRGVFPDFLQETAHIRNDKSWKVGSIPSDLQDRRVEITGPVDRKMIINALNSGAKVFMADFEDASTPTWNNMIQGQVNLRDAVNKSITYSSPEGKEYKLNNEIATLIVRPRGWHLPENHLEFNGKPSLGALVDFGLYFFHNHKQLLQNGTGPYFYLPKLESHLEARLWHDIFVYAEEKLSLSIGTIKATVLIETIMATFEMEEILFELKEHIVALNCGRWDYIFSFIKKFNKFPEFILPDRASVTMATHFMNSYSLLLIKTCHARGAFAMGGMSAFIPIKNDAEANKIALERVKADKEREANNGHDGTWVAHPALVPVAKEVFDRIMLGKNQLTKMRDDIITAKDLITVPNGDITEAGLRNNVSVSIQYLESWLRGNGCVPIFNLMEDAATAEISRAQVWQWIKHPNAVLSDGRQINFSLVKTLINEELAKIKQSLTEENLKNRQFDLAVKIFEDLISKEEFVDFLTLPASNYVD